MSRKNNTGAALLSVLVVVMVAGGLRSPITSVSPVLSTLKADLDLDNIQGSLLTSIPLVVFASCSIAVSRFAARRNIHYSILYALLLLAVGLGLRVYGNATMLYAGSFIIGLGICIGNVTTPAYIRKIFPEQVGMMTGIFSVAMNLVAALASGLSLAIGTWTGLGWQGSLGIWIIWAALALLVAGLEVLRNRNRRSGLETAGREVSDPAGASPGPRFNIFRSRQAWNISIFMGIQSLVYYCLVALLPVLLVDYGMPEEKTGLVLLVIQLAMLPVLFLGPLIATKTKDQQWVVYGAGALMFTGVALLILFRAQYIYGAAVLIGMASGLAFSLSIVFFSLKSKTPAGVLRISGKAQSVGYLIAAFGPPVFGMLHDGDSSWRSSFYFLLLMVVVMVFFGRLAARPRFIEDH